MQIHIKQYEERLRALLTRFRDIRFSGQVIFAVIVLLISWSGVKAIQANYGLERQVAALSQQNTIQKLENENLQLENTYYDSNQYLELSARQDFGLGAPGESEMLVSKNAALSYTVNPPSSVTKVTAANTHESASQRNLQDWINFFMHRQNQSD